MFYRKKQNASGSISVQIISKTLGKYKVVMTIGSSFNEQEVQRLTYLAKLVVVADAGLLSNDNIRALEELDYQYIIGARIKSESEK